MAKEPDTLEDGRPRNSRIRFVLFLAGALLVVFFYMIKNLLIGVVLGMLLWATTRKYYERLAQKLRRRGLAALLSVLGTLIFLVVPMILLLLYMVIDVSHLAKDAQEMIQTFRPTLEAKLQRLIESERFDILGYEVDSANLSQRIEQATIAALNFLLTVLKKILGGIANMFILLLVMLYTLFFFYLDGPAFFDWIKKMLPLTPEQSDKLFRNFFSTSLATLKTLGVIGVIQGAMGGLAFWVCGIPSPFFWTVIMALATIIPSVGAQIILFPAGFLLMIFGKFWYGLGLILWSWIVIANVDNILRPYLVKRAINLHELVVFLSTIGGIAVFGFFGFLIGPVIAALLKATLEIYSDMYKLNAFESSA